MPVDSFRFVSPGVFINEIDQSQISTTTTIGAGPVVFGTAEKGPALVPTRVSSFGEFVQIFGNPIPGSAANSDVWRNGNYSNPTYGAYAAQAYLANGSPLTFVRLVGDQESGGATAGWDIPKLAVDSGGVQTSEGATYGLFIIGSGSVTDQMRFASGTITVSGFGVPMNGKIVTIENSAGLVKEYEAAAAQNLTVDPPLFAYTTSAAAVATSLAACIADPTNGHGTTITVVDDGAGELSLTQAVAGTDGNDTITTDSGDITPVGFAGGLGPPTFGEGVYGEGVLAAIIQTTGSRTTVELNGPLGGTGSAVTAAGALVGCASSTGGSANEFRVRISGSSETIETTFNFDPKSARYIRKVFNTNPHLLNDQITPAANLKDHFLAESYEKFVLDSVGNWEDGGDITRTNFSGTMGVVLALESGSVYGGDFNQGYSTPGTPWIVGQDLNTDTSTFDINNTVQRLFRVMSREGTEYAQSHYKISISDVKQSSNPQFQPYGSFTLLVRDIKDIDEDPRILEQFNNLDLNPASSNFIGKRIGDRSYSYDSVNQKWKEVGQYPVQSQFIRVELDPTVENGDQDASLVPFGFRGIPAYTALQLQSGSTKVLNYNLSGSGSNPAAVPVLNICANGASGSLPLDALSAETNIQLCAVDFGGVHKNAPMFQTASLVFPTLPLRANASDGRLSKETKAFFGLSTNQGPTTPIFDGSIRDLVRIKPTSATATNLILGPGFSLDDIVWNGATWTHSGSDVFLYNDTVVGAGNPAATPNGGNIRRGTPQGARRAGTSQTALSASYTQVLNEDINKFTVPMYGGFDGFDLFEKNPFNNTRAVDNAISNKTTTAYPMYFTLRKAIDSVGDVDQVNINAAVMPGITDEQTTDFLLAMAENRKDTLAIIDLEGGYTSSTENTDAFSDRVGSSATTVTDLEARNLNSSYGCTYYPWVQIVDNRARARLWVPPSTIALGVLASSAARSELWFAPAGFNRGGLNNRSAGLSVVNVVEKLTATQRDNLYEVNINPIASFPAEGLVVFGQKTLQATSSALDRINVRRLMIFLKKEIRLIANTILFDPNQQVTWNRFLNQVNPFLASIKSRFGLSDYRVILDTSTTTPDMVDRNIMYAKILLKPTRAIEFIALDFVITRSGVEFE